MKNTKIDQAIFDYIDKVKEKGLNLENITLDVKETFKLTDNQTIGVMERYYMQ